MQLKQQENIRNVLVISDMVIEPFLDQQIEACFKDIEIKLKTDYVNYSEYVSSFTISLLEKADIIIVWLRINIEEYVFDTQSMKSKHLMESYQKFYKYINDNTYGKIFWFGIDSLFNKLNYLSGNVYSPLMQIEKIKIELSQMLGETVVHINTDRLVALNGIDNTYSIKYLLRWNCPYKENLFVHVAQEIKKQYKILIGMSPKCIILDCDNVLWEGIVSEDGIENIKVGGNGSGKIYREFQKHLLMMHDMGIILAICSKNDENDVLSVFQNHSAMILKEEHIACFQINWDNKPANIKIISEKLKIDIDSMVFIDDSKFEVESVKSILPQVHSILFEKTTIFEKLSCFNINHIVNNASAELRNKTYKTNTYRDNLKTQHENIDHYLTSLKQVIEIKKAGETELYRIAELSQRCNRCTNGIRYNVNQLNSKFHEKSYVLYVVYMSDIFGDLGLVGVMGVEQQFNGDILMSELLDLFCLSCRVLERKVEDEMINHLSSTHAISKMNNSNTTKNLAILEKLQKLIIQGERK